MKTILYIDHSESWKFLLGEELSEEGYKVVTANNIEEALSKGRDINPNLIILELRQKRFEGESFEDLKKQFPDIPWIGYSTFFQCPSEYKKWVDYYLPKWPQMEGIKSLVRGLSTVSSVKKLFDGRRKSLKKEISDENGRGKRKGEGLGD